MSNNWSAEAFKNTPRWQQIPNPEEGYYDERMQSSTAASEDWI